MSQMHKVYQRKVKKDKSLISSTKDNAQKKDFLVPETPGKLTAERLQRVYVRRKNHVDGSGGSWISLCHIPNEFLNNEAFSEESCGESSKRPCDSGGMVDSDVEQGIGELDEQLVNCVSRNLDNEAPPTLISFTILESVDIAAETSQQNLATESNVSIEPSINPSPQYADDEQNTQYQEFDMCFASPTPVKCTGRKRKNDNELDGRLQKRPKKKYYWPKVVGQGRHKKTPKIPNESKTKRPAKPKTAPKKNGYGKKPTRTSKRKTPKPSTRKENTSSKRKYVRQTTLAEEDASSIRTCRRSINFDNIEQKYENGQNKVTSRERGASVTNSWGLQSNSLQVFEKKLKIGTCLIESRKVHPNFSRACKKRRIQRQKTISSRLKSCMVYLDSIRVFNIKCLRKKKRSNRIQRRSNMLLVDRIEESLPKISNVVNSKFLKGSESPSEEKCKMIGISNEVMEFLIDKFMSMKIDGRRKGRKKDNASNNALVLYNGVDGKLFPYQKPKKKLLVRVAIDEETLKVFNLLMEGKEHIEADEEKRKYWEEERNIFQKRADSFISRMHLILGNRQFSPWKGSVMDSIAGVFLTQNVSDHLSSSAFINLAATFPIQKTTSHESDGDSTYNSQESAGIDTNPFNLTSEKIKDVNVDDSSNATTSSSLSHIHKSSGGSPTSNKENKNHIKRMNNKPLSPGMVYGKKKTTIPKKNEDVEETKRKEEEEKQYWTRLREIYSCPRHCDHMDSVNWEAVWNASPERVAEAIKGRGQHHIIADRILAFIRKLKETHGTIDVEWLREAPPNKVKEYLLKVYGLGLKSVECIRLLALQQIAFPVDVNVGRIVVRLGWVPLQPMPDYVAMHQLEKFPLTDIIQKYLWPRLCTLDQRTLYELHYQMITFGKVFCTKANPNCNACPMKGECKHFASALGSVRLPITAPTTDNKPTETQIVRSKVPTKCFPDFTLLNNLGSICEVNNSEYEAKECEPIIEMPASPELECKGEFKDIEEFGEECENLEDFFLEDDSEEIPTINLSNEGQVSNLQSFLDDQEDMNMSNALVALTANAESIPTPPMKVASRLRTERVVYEIPDCHPLLDGYEIREPDDPSPYLLVIWLAEGEITYSCEESKKTAPGTILIPCRTAMRGSFPLNGTYFQVNEMFADHYSSEYPINVPRNWIWNLQRRIAFFGTSTTTIFRGLSVGPIQYCFWKGFICVRAFDRTTRCPMPLSHKFHLSTTNQQGKKQGVKQKKETEG